jgi:hypothetical protein
LRNRGGSLSHAAMPGTPRDLRYRGKGQELLVCAHFGPGADKGNMAVIIRPNE